MKKIYLTLLSLLALATTACNDFLDVRPKGEKVENDQFETAKGFEDAIYGVYGSMTDKALYGMDMVWGIPEILGQNLRCYATDTHNLARYKYTDNKDLKARFSKMWSKGYETIGYANNVLQNLDKKDPAEFPLYKAYRAEMLGVRAMMHFDLLRLFAPVDRSKRGIPYVKTFNFSVKPFSTVGECLDFIIGDLTEAEGLLKDMETMAYPRDNGQYERFCRWRESHINYYAVQALLARVYWYMGNNAKAAEYAEKVINSNLFPLVDVTEVQNRIAGVLSPKETIFGLYSQQYLEWSSTYLYTWQSYVSYIAYDNSGGTNYLMPWSALYALDLAGTEQDFRKNHFRVESSLAKCLKMVDYPTIENNNVSTRPELISGISLINVSELYLIAADALLSTNYDMALKYFNDEIRSRGLSPLIAGQTLTSERIFNEYRKETFCEGLHWFNMKRLNRDILSNAESRTIPANDDIYVLPIPEEEMEYRPEANNNQ